MFFKGDHQPVALHVRRAVAEFVSDPGDHYKNADVELTLSGETWAKLYLSSESAEKLIRDGEIDVKKGAANEAAELFALFDKYRSEKAVLVRPHLHD